MITSTPDTMATLVTDLLLEHAQNVPSQRPFPGALSIRKDLAVESLSLVAVTLRLGEELNVDVLEAGIELGGLDTVDDLVAVARRLAQRPQQTTS
jgi:hypothetical protein